jgi:hypothetical protein
MQFLDHFDVDDPARVKSNFDAYGRYLEEHKEDFPREAYEFATANWHYDPQHHACLHNTWVESLEVIESTSTYHEKLRQTDIRLTLLGAYNDGRIEINYENVNGYRLGLASSNTAVNSHGDWLIDEIRLTESRSLIHEIKFWKDGNWQIECSNIRFKWIPLGDQSQDEN